VVFLPVSVCVCGAGGGGGEWGVGGAELAGGWRVYARVCTMEGAPYDSLSAGSRAGSRPPGGEEGHSGAPGRGSADGGAASSVSASGSGGDTPTAPHLYEPHPRGPSLR